MKRETTLPPGHRRRAAVVLAVLFGLAASCSDQGPDSAPADESIQGHVRLVGNTFDIQGHSTGTLTTEEADGVVVYLARPGGAVDSTVTSHGSYSFTGLAAGTYRVSTWVAPGHVIESPAITLSTTQGANADTLVVGPFGDMKCSPNPADPDGFGLEFTMQAAGEAILEILTAGRTVVWSYTAPVVAGFNHIHWDGDDLAEQPAPTGAYWAVVKKEGTTAYNLAFWVSGEDLPDPGNCGHVVAAGYQVVEGGNPVVTSWLGSLHGEIGAHVGETGTLQWVFLRPDSTAFAIADSCSENHMTWVLGDSTVAAVSRDPGVQWTFHLTGLRAGSTTLVLHAWHEDHVHLSTPPIPVEVTTP